MSLHRLSVDVGYPIVVIDTSPTACVRTFKRVIEARIRKNLDGGARKREDVLRDLVRQVAENRDRFITKIEPSVEVDGNPYFEHYKG